MDRRCKHILPLLLVSLSMLFLSDPASAQECFAPSPSVMGGIDIYEPVRARTISSWEHQNLEQLFAHLDQEWKGSGEALICEGKKSRGPKENRIQYMITAEGEVSLSDQLTVRAELYDAKERTTRHETIRLLLESDRLRAHHGGYGDIALLKVSSRELVYLEKYRQLNARGSGGIMKEVLTVIEAGPFSFSLERSVFTQGELSSWLYWDLKKR